MPLVLLILVTLAAGGAAAQELNAHSFPPGARAYGMGGAFVAVADDASALYWNPAALVDSRFGLLGSAGIQQYARLEELGGLFDDENGESEEGEDGFPFELPAKETVPAAGLVALTIGPVGLGAQIEAGLSANLDEKVVAVVDQEGEPWDDPEDPGQPLFSEAFPSGSADVALLSSARAGLGVRVLSLGPVGTLALGVAGSYYLAGSRMVISAEPGDDLTVIDLENPEVDERHDFFSGSQTEFTAVDGYGLDVGLKARLSPWITVGAVARDVVNTLTWSGKQTTYEVYYDPEAGEIVDEETPPTTLTLPANRPMTYQLGVAVTPPLLGVTLAADLDSENVAHVGAEWRTLFGILALRAGYLTPLGGSELPAAYGAPVRLGLGLGLPFLRLNAGAGFESTGTLSTARDAMVELSLHF